MTYREIPCGPRSSCAHTQCQWQDEATMSEQDKLLGGKFHASVVYSRCRDPVKKILSICLLIFTSLSLSLSHTHTSGTNHPPPYHTSPTAQAGQAPPPPYQQYPSTTTVVVGQILHTIACKNTFSRRLCALYHKSSRQRQLDDL